MPKQRQAFGHAPGPAAVAACSFVVVVEAMHAPMGLLIWVWGGWVNDGGCIHPCMHASSRARTCARTHREADGGRNAAAPGSNASSRAEGTSGGRTMAGLGWAWFLAWLWAVVWDGRDVWGERHLVMLKPVRGSTWGFHLPLRVDLSGGRINCPGHRTRSNHQGQNSKP